jgi:hypothetical protein
MSLRKLPFKHNKEKKFFEKWTPERAIENFPHPHRMLITGLPNSGKTTMALSIIAAAKPTFDEIILMHAKYFDAALSPEDNKDIEIAGDQVHVPEYEDVDFTCALKTVPLGYSYFKKFQNEKGSKKNLLIIDDCELLEWAKGKRERQVALNKLFSYQSTHHGLSILILAQDPTTQLNVSIRRECNVFIVFKGRDRNAIQYFATNVGFPKNVLVQLFGMCKSNHDSICFDFTDMSPYPVRFNVVNPIELIDGSKEKKE